MDCSPPGSSVHGIFQARVLEWDAIAFSITTQYFKACSCLCALGQVDPREIGSSGYTTMLHGCCKQSKCLTWGFNFYFKCNWSFSNGYAVFLSKFGKCIPLIFGSDGKASVYNVRDLGLIPGLGRFPGEGNGTHSSTLALKIRWTEELGAGYYPWGWKESGTTEQHHFTLLFVYPLMGKAEWGGNSVCWWLV